MGREVGLDVHFVNYITVQGDESATLGNFSTILRRSLNSFFRSDSLPVSWS